MVMIAVSGFAWLVSRDVFRSPNEDERRIASCSRLEADLERLRVSTNACAKDLDCTHHRGSCQSAAVGSNLTTMISIEETLAAGCDWVMTYRDCGRTEPVCLKNLCNVRSVD
jgi:hypothetical protein